MIDGLRSYPAYKDSGVPWLGEIPTHWSLLPNRAMLRRRKILVGKRHTDYELLSLTKIGIIVRDVSTGRGKFSADMGTSQEVRCGDLIFCLFDVPETPRTVGLSQHRGMITGAYSVFECNDRVLTRYLEAFYIAMDDRKLLSPLYSGLRNTIPTSRFLGVKTPVPPFPEQTAIVRFLDHADRRIRRYLRAKHKLIALLEEQKQAIIHQAVTGQIDVRTGQPYPAYKPSGVEWLGEVPAHWERRAVQQLFQIGRGKVTSHEYIANHPGPFPLYSSQTENDGVMGYIDTFMFEGDFLTWTTDGAHAGTVFRRSGKFNCTNVCGTLLPKTQLDLDFMRMAIASETKRQVRLDINPKLMNNMMARIRISVPPYDEQVRIAKYVQRVVEPSDLVIERTQREIDLLHEYRTRLITDVVTGKLDAREAAAALPEVDPLAAEDTLNDTIDTGPESDIDELDVILEEAEA